MWFLLLMSVFSSPDDYFPGIPYALATIPVMDEASPTIPPEYDPPPLEPIAQRAVAALYKALVNDERGKDAAAQALLDMNPGALPSLFSALRSSDAATRQAACRAMLKITPEDKAKGPILAAAAQQDVLIVRLFAIMALGTIADAYDQSANTLVKALEDPSEQIRMCAISHLLQGGYRPDDATLQKLMKSEKNVDIRDTVVKLQALTPSKVFSPHVRWPMGYDNNDASCPYPIIEENCYLAPDVKEIKQNTKLLKKRDSGIKIAAARELAKFGPGAEAAQSRMIKLLRDEDHLVRAHAAVALRHIGARDPKVINALLKLLQEENTKVLTTHLAWSDPVTRARDAAAWALGNMMPEAKAAAPEMLRGLAWLPLGQNENNSRMRNQSAEGANDYLSKGVVEGFACAGQTIIPAIKAALESNDPITRGLAIRAVFCMPRRNDLLSEDHLFLALHDPVTAIGATSELADRGALGRALPHVESLLKSPKSAIQMNALSLLQRLGMEGQTAEPWVIALMRSIDMSTGSKPDKSNTHVYLTYSCALRTLGYIGQGSAEAKEAVVSALENDFQNHQAAAESLDKLFSDPPDIWKCRY